MKKFLEGQFEQDVKLIQKPKEVVFIGKANTGKSSLINKILDFPSCRISKKAVNLKGHHKILQFLRHWTSIGKNRRQSELQMSKNETLNSLVKNDQKLPHFFDLIIEDIFLHRFGLWT